MTLEYHILVRARSRFKVVKCLVCHALHIIRCLVTNRIRQYYIGSQDILFAIFEKLLL